MALSIAIPLHTFTASEVVTVPATNIPTGNTHAQLLINRNVGTNSLEANPAASISWFMEFSLDGGQTFGNGAGAGTVGGLLASGGHVSDVGDDLPGDPQSTLRQVRGSVTNGATTLSVSGSLNLT